MNGRVSFDDMCRQQQVSIRTSESLYAASHHDSPADMMRGCKQNTTGASRSGRDTRPRIEGRIGAIDAAQAAADPLKHLNESTEFGATFDQFGCPADTYCLDHVVAVDIPPALAEWNGMGWEWRREQQDR